MEFNVLYNSSTSLQNAILQILAEGRPEGNTPVSTTTPAEPKNEVDTSTIEQILENGKPEEVRPINRARRLKHRHHNTTDSNEPVTTKPTTVTNPPEPVTTGGNKPKQLVTKNKVLTATEIIYRAMLNEQEHEEEALEGGNKAETMINNILTGGNNELPDGNKPESTVKTPKENLFDEIHEVAPAERAQMNIFTGGAGGFASALNKYKSTQNAVDDISSDNEEPLEDIEEESSDDGKDLMNQFKAINKNGTNYMAQKLNIEEEDENDMSKESDSSISSSGSDDDFIDSLEPHHTDTLADKKTNAKYIKLIKQFKSPAPKGSILGGAVSRPKTVTLINAFPYILKANPEGSNV